MNLLWVIPPIVALALAVLLLLDSAARRLVETIAAAQE